MHEKASRTQSPRWENTQGYIIICLRTRSVCSYTRLILGDLLSNSQASSWNTAKHRNLLDELTDCQRFCAQWHWMKLPGKVVSYLQTDFSSDYQISFFDWFLLWFKHESSCGFFFFPSLLHGLLETPLTYHVMLYQHHHVIMGLHSLRQNLVRPERKFGSAFLCRTESY